MEDYLLKVKVQNNKIVSLMRQRGIETVAELHRQTKIPQGTLHDFINMTASPLMQHDIFGKSGSSIHGDGLWRKAALMLADFFGVLPDEMFNEQQLTSPLKDNKAERAIELEQMILLMSGQQPELLEDESRFEEEKKKILDDVLQTLTPREQKVLEQRFGLIDEPLTLEESAVANHVTRERIRQIEAKALRKLRLPHRTNKLEEIIEEKTENDPFNFKTRVTFKLKDEQKKILIQAGCKWGEAAQNHNIHLASAAKFIHELRTQQN